MIKVWVVDDSVLVRKVFRQILSNEADMVRAFARGGKEALAQLGAFAPDVVTLDINMPDMDGLACLDRIMIERPCRTALESSGVRVEECMNRVEAPEQVLQSLPD